MLALSKADRKQLRTAILSAYPSQGDLAIFVDEELDESLAVIAGGSNLQQVVFNLIAWAEAKGRTEDLVRALDGNTQNPEVKQFCDRVLHDSSTQASSSIPNAPVSAPVSRSSSQPVSNDGTAPSIPSIKEPIEVFISYSHKEESLKDELYVHMANLTRQGAIKPWQDRDIVAGEEWDAEIKARLESAGIILLLITPRFIASEYCFDKEMQRAMERHKEGTARVIPIIMKASDWKGSPFSKLQVLPKDAKPVNQWADQDEALLDVVQGIRRAVASLAAK